MILINGEPGQHIETSDRGFQYGDGLFETIEVIDSYPVFLDFHLQRLQKGCKNLHIPLISIDQLINEVWQLSKDQSKAVIKIIITRGSGGRGYRQPDPIQPTRIVSLHPYPQYPAPYETQGIHARFCTTHLGINPALAGIKHLNRLEQILARAEWQDPAIQEGIMLDSDNRVVEGTMSNIFFIKSGIIYTPSVTNCGVAGVIRSVIMKIVREKQLAVVECRVTEAELLTADEIFVCNSIIGIWPVVRLGTTAFPIGATTLKIQQWLTHLKKRIPQ